MVKIGTHNGTFHCDEALACYLLRLTKKYENAEIVRTRNPNELDQLDIIVDVGAVYDPSKGRFDHHQKGFFQTFSPAFKTKLSSAGLIYKHFGLEIIKNLTNVNDSDATLIYNHVYKSFIEGIDGIDNGISQYPSDLIPTYKISTDLSARVSRLNPGWNEVDVDVMERFNRAMKLTGNEFVERVKFYPTSFFPARGIVKDALESRKLVHPTGEILVLKQYTLWKKHLFQLEEETSLNEEEKIKYCLYGDKNGSWRVQAVPIHDSSFVSRIPLPEEWRGIRSEALSKISGIDDCVFVHASGFIGGNITYEGALLMAKKALAMSEKSVGPTKKCDVEKVKPSNETQPIQKKQKVDDGSQAIA